MARVDPTTKRDLIGCIKDGKSLNKISKELGLPKTTIYYHYRKILGKQILQPTFFISESEIEGEIIGAFAADGGCLTKPGIYEIRFYLGGNEKEYCNTIVALLSSYFNKRPYVYLTPNKNLITIRYRSKVIYNFVKNYLIWEGKKVYSIKLKTIETNIAFLKGFIRGYFDCDGYSYPDYRKVVLMGVSGGMLNQIYNILIVLGFFPHTYTHIEKRENMKDLYNVFLKGDQATKFIEFIKPNNPRRIKKWGCRDSNYRSI